MKVFCVKVINPTTNEEVLEHPGVRLHGEYRVLSILVQPGRGAKFRIVTDDGTPALFNAAMFATSDGNLPPNWVVRASETGVVEIAPAKWLQPGFWERFFDGDPAAREDFAAEQERGRSA